MKKLIGVPLILTVSLITLSGCGLRPLGDGRKRENTPTVKVILTGLDNPRGVAVSPAGELFVAEAGTGYDAVDIFRKTGKFTRFIDRNGDGDFDDDGEADRWFSNLPTYNALQYFGTHRDEVNGPGDVLLHRDGRLFFTLDGGFEDMALFEAMPGGVRGRNLASRSNMNGIAFDLDQEHIYIVESTLNQLIEVTLDGERREIVVFPLLESNQQAVPAGLSVDPRNGDILVALFSGVAKGGETGEFIPFVPGDARVVRVDPETGAFTDEITGLTTAVDVEIDAAGNIFVVEMASDYADLLPKLFDIFDPEAPPLHGGYLRYSGRVTHHPPNGAKPRVLADRLDMPTNITLGPDGALFVSTGQGTPGRSIPGTDGPTRIVGEIVMITGY